MYRCTCIGACGWEWLEKGQQETWNGSHLYIIEGLTLPQTNLGSHLRTPIPQNIASSKPAELFSHFAVTRRVMLAWHVSCSLFFCLPHGGYYAVARELFSLFLGLGHRRSNICLACVILWSSVCGSWSSGVCIYQVWGLFSLFTRAFWVVRTPPVKKLLRHSMGTNTQHSPVTLRICFNLC